MVWIVPKRGTKPAAKKQQKPPAPQQEHSCGFGTSDPETAQSIPRNSVHFLDAGWHPACL